MINHIKIILLIICVITGNALAQSPGKINRQALVSRHNVKNVKADSLSSLSVGNGRFAFTVDVTGLQTFPEFYKKGVSLGTQSEWGWHSFPNNGNYKWEESLKEYTLNGKKITYSVQWKEPKRNKEASDYFRVNEHRLQLGNIGLDIVKKDGSNCRLQDIKDIRQELNVWTGEIKSHFSVEGVPVDVITFGHQQQDLVAVQVRSPLITSGKLSIRMRFPYPTGEFLDAGVNWKNAEKHRSVILQQDESGATIQRTLDTTVYYTGITWNKNAAVLQEKEAHYFRIMPKGKSGVLEAGILFTEQKDHGAVAGFAETKTNSETEWKKFWTSGGAVDLSGSTDPRAHELERRIILSQYLTKIQCAGNFPPQETGLTYNSWFGKPHLEMHWWHAAHYALWNRPEILEKGLDWYATVEEGARSIAKRQGFDGIRWQKMTDNEGRESPSSVGAFLIWQQPHFIYMAEELYRINKDQRFIDKYKDLIFKTADFMASFPTYDAEKGRYNLGKGLIPAQECFDAVSTFNPTYELAYWHWALSIAQEWRKRAGLAPKKEWNEVLAKLAPLPHLNGVYLATESTPDCYITERYKTDHPAVLATYSTLPASNNLDTAMMRRTFDLVWKVWNWGHTWGWDFPLTAMTATRLHMPEKAVDALFMNVQKNTYLSNGHNYQDVRLTIYLPGNGGILAAVAMMCAGFDGNTEPNPGFPKNGKWNVKWEGLNKMP
jgi:hypothetical protein